MTKWISLLGIILVFVTTSLQAQHIRFYDLRCEYMVNPIGLDESHPRFTWKLQHALPEQPSINVWISRDTTDWSTAIVLKPNDRNRTVYQGAPLESFTRYYWKVGTTDQKFQGPVQYFDMGILHPSQWKGSWISDGLDVHLKPAAYFRYPYKASKSIRKATAYVSAGGLYELSINGKRVGDQFMNPMYTRYDRRLLYVAEDVTPYLQQGENVFGVILGNGWYNHQSQAVWDYEKAPWRARPTFCMDVHVAYTDGSHEIIGTDRSWKTQRGPLVFNSIYTASHYDARLEMSGWDQPGFTDSTWQASIIRSAPSPVISAQIMEPVRLKDPIWPVGFTKINDSIYTYDLGVNISGISELEIAGAPGTVVSVVHAEVLDSRGMADIKDIVVHYRPQDDQDPFQTDVYTLKGSGKETFRPLFNYKGFQYVTVKSSRPITLHARSLKGYFLHSDVKPVGRIESSDTVLNKIWEATNRAYLSNLFGYPTDCPQREKNGWTGDAHIAIETALYNYDGITVYEKWLQDHRDEQQPNGVLPSIIPSPSWGYAWGNGPDWTSTIAIIPWNLYVFYGDTKPLKANYEPLKRYVTYMEERWPSGITDWGLGDWVPVKSKTPVPLTSTAYYYTDVLILSKMAEILGHQEDAQYYKQLATHIRNAFNQAFYNPQTKMYGSGTQTPLSVALYWGLVPEEDRAEVAANLAKRVRADGHQLDVGLLGSKAILNALSENGYIEDAYKLASRRTYPSWGWWIMNGATTLFENWDIDAQQDLSRNHIMFGEIGAWFYKGIGGLFPVEKAPGFKEILLKPQFPKGLNYFASEFESIRGPIKSKWERKGKLIRYEIVIPTETTATLHLPTEVVHLKAGKHVFTIR
jgi:alpha-L-rhamnosidase